MPLTPDEEATEKEEQEKQEAKQEEVVRLSLENARRTLGQYKPEKEYSIRFIGSEENKKRIIDDFKEQFPDHKEPVANEDGSVDLPFKSREDSMNFLMSQANKKHEFMVIDPRTNTLKAYSNGDGKLYHSNGNEVKSGDKLEPSNVKVEDFLKSKGLEIDYGTPPAAPAPRPK